jgi:U3 small nucleolar RNA-associated protein 25
VFFFIAQDGDVPAEGVSGNKGDKAKRGGDTTSAYNIVNVDRFEEEYGYEIDDDVAKAAKDGKKKKKKRPRPLPVDYFETFGGDMNDLFRLGISFAGKMMRLYTEFHKSDIIIASPLAVKMMLGKSEEVDVLSSIEVVMVYKADVMLMQNWDHVAEIFENLNQVPARPHESTDFSRIRDWSLMGKGDSFRQNVVISAIQDPLLQGLMNKFCPNMHGRLRIKSHYPGSITTVIPRIRQLFQRFAFDSIQGLDDARFEYFKANIFPQLHKGEGADSKGANVTHDARKTVVYIPSYFDFVRIRNLFRREGAKFCTCNEYSSTSNVAKARFSFFHGKVSVMLYTERFHFYKRFAIRGTESVIFYGVPSFPHFYSEVLNFMALPGSDAESASMSSFCLFNKYDTMKLEGIVGTARAKPFTASKKKAFMIC